MNNCSQDWWGVATSFGYGFKAPCDWEKLGHCPLLHQSYQSEDDR